MEIITTHNNTDFDGFAAMMAGKKLYPEAKLVFSGKLHRNVREFMSLHKDALNVELVKDIPLAEVDRLILVDTKTRNRIGELKELSLRNGVDIHIYDHHPRFTDDVQGNLEVIEEVGAATTLLVEAIKDQNLPVSPFEATIYALGIYEDTGCLTFSTTTSRDAEAIAYLLACGARLSVIADFIGRPLTENQKNLLNTLLAAAENIEINGVNILIAKTSVEEYISGLSLLTHKLGDIYNIDVTFVVVQMDDRVHIVARNKLDSVDLREILLEFGGGGHATAASASVKGAQVEEVAQKLLAILKGKIRPEIVAAEIMSSPVKFVDLNLSIEEAGKILLRYGHTGLPVVNQYGHMVGIISRRDIDKAKHHGLGHAPVKGYMSHRVISITPQTTLQEIQHTMIKYNIGRLPVIAQNKIMGIVSRTDVLRTLHGDQFPERHRQVFNSKAPVKKSSTNLQKKINKNLPQDISLLLEKVGLLADKRNLPVYAVGGFVRDLLLGVENFDIDIVVEGDGITFARELAEFLCGRVRIYEKFGTAIVILENNFKIDIATARTEYYEFPAALPKVENSSLRQDLYRRDFTINAMALSLNRKNFGELIDFFNGRRDLDEGVVRILYNLSFIEDPTRILRAVRFEQRYNFKIEEQTLDLAKSAIKDKMLVKLTGDRVRGELKTILNEPASWKAVARMKGLEVWAQILPGVEINPKVKKVMEKIPEAITVLEEEFEPEQYSPWLVNLIGLIHLIKPEELGEIALRLNLTNEEEHIISQVLTLCPGLTRVLDSKKELRPSALYNLLHDVPAEVLALAITRAKTGMVLKRIKFYFSCRRYNKLEITGDDIKSMGYKPGPLFGEVLAQVQNARLDGLVKNRQEELEFAREYLKKKEGN